MRDDIVFADQAQGGLVCVVEPLTADLAVQAGNLLDCTEVVGGPGLGTLRAAVPGLEGFSWEPQRVAAQGDLVFTHSLVHGWGPGPTVIVDIFRLENDRIVEHWDVVQDLIRPEATASGNSMV